MPPGMTPRTFNAPLRITTYDGRPGTAIAAKPTPQVGSWWLVPRESFAEAQAVAQARMSGTSDDIIATGKRGRPAKEK